MMYFTCEDRYLYNTNFYNKQHIDEYENDSYSDNFISTITFSRSIHQLTKTKSKLLEVKNVMLCQNEIKI